MHGQEQVTLLYSRGDEGPHPCLAAGRLDEHPLGRPQAQVRRVGWVDLDVRVLRVELSQDVGPPSRFVVFENSREPIALHWPVIEFGPVPGRPMLPVMSARLMMACAVRTP